MAAIREAWGRNMADGTSRRPATGAARNTAEPVVMQRENERGRVIVEGRRTDDGDRCKLVVIHESGGTWAWYPHGWDTFGVRLAKAEVDVVVQAILNGSR